MSSLTQAKTSWLKVQTFIDEWVLFSFSAKLKFALKVSLSLALAYIIPMAMGWSQPNTAAITVMLIATAGAVNESVMKGVIRVIGTVLGAIIGIALIALFPQDRMLYLSVLSLVIGVVIYLYYAYQGDSTVFMLMAMTIMMIFMNGPDKAFLYGIDRTYMTVFGIVVYTLVGVFIWPVKQVDSTIEDAQALSEKQGALFKALGSEPEVLNELHTQLLEREAALEKSYVKSSENSFDIALNHKAWEQLQGDYKQINLLLSALIAQEKKKVNFESYIPRYKEIHQSLELNFEQLIKAWKVADTDAMKQVNIKLDEAALGHLSHLDRALVITHYRLLKKLSEALNRVLQRINYLKGEGEILEEQAPRRTSSRFVWLDPENFKSTMQLLTVFWVTTLFWIFFNPPLGFLLVILATLLGLLTTFSPLKPSILIVLLSMGFIFSTLMYVFVLPNLVYGWHLFLFIFGYTFISFYLLPPKITIFFLLGLFLLGISNTMVYNFDFYLNTLLVFYLFLLVLMFFKHFPFSAKPEHLFESLVLRFFRHAHKLLANFNQEKKSSLLLRWIQKYHQEHLHIALNKMKVWAEHIDFDYFDKNTAVQIQALVQACENLHYFLQNLLEDEVKYVNNTIFKSLRKDEGMSLMEQMSNACLQTQRIAPLDKKLQNIKALIDELEAKLDSFAQAASPEDYTKEEIADFYINLGLREGVVRAFHACHASLMKVEWKQLKENRF